MSRLPARPVFDARAMKANCDACPLNDCAPVPPEGPADAAIVFVGDAPGKMEVQFGKPLVGPMGVKLDEVLWKAGLKRSQVRLTNALLCRPEVPYETGKKRYDVKEYVAWLRRENVKRRKLKQEEIASPFDCCWPRLRREIWEADRWAWRRGAPNGAVVTPLSNFALKMVSGAQGILKYRGSVLAPKAGDAE